MSDILNNPLTGTIMFLIGNAISIYFIYQIIRGVYYELTKGRDDDL